MNDGNCVAFMKGFHGEWLQEVRAFYSEISGCYLSLCLEICCLRIDRRLGFRKMDSRNNFDSNFFNLQKNGAYNSGGSDQLLVTATAKVEVLQRFPQIGLFRTSPVQSRTTAKEQLPDS